MKDCMSFLNVEKASNKIQNPFMTRTYQCIWCKGNTPDNNKGGIEQPHTYDYTQGIHKHFDCKARAFWHFCSVIMEVLIKAVVQEKRNRRLQIRKDEIKQCACRYDP